MRQRTVFDESWYRVSRSQVRLLPGVEMIRQMFRGEPWYVVCDKLGHRFFRVRPAAYRFICYLEDASSVEEAWERALEIDPHDAPGQGEVVQLLSQLYQSGLLRSDQAADIDALEDAKMREDKQKQKQRFSSLLFLKIRLFNPDPFLRKTLSLFAWLFTPVGALLWTLVFIWGALALIENWSEFADTSRSILGWSNLPYLYLSLIITKVLHEFGHAYACRRYGREVPEMGIMLLVFNPLPYVDASSCYAFARKYQRVIVGIAGMAVELFVAAIAVKVWAEGADGIMTRVAYNVAITASVGALLFNLNPLLRFDGYHILCDLLETPNLQGRSQSLMGWWVNKKIFKIDPGPIPTTSRREQVGFTCYFFASWVYRFLLMIGILIFVSKQFMILGMILALIFCVVWVFLPPFKGFKYLFFSPKLMNRRMRAIGIVTCFLAVVFAFLAFFPMPYSFRSEGIVKSADFQHVYTSSPGRIAKLVTPSGTMVEAGQVLVQLTNQELEHEGELIRIERERAQLLMHQDRSEQGTQLAGLKAFLKALDSRQAALNAQLESLVVRAPIAGRWISDQLHEVTGSVVPRGQTLGIVRAETGYVFTAVVHQRDAGRFSLVDSELKIYGQEGETLKLTEIEAIPAGQDDLPSAALGVAGGGSAGVAPDQQGGGSATETYFQVRGKINMTEASAPQHGQRGVARFPLPKTPLLRQWTHAIRQFFQQEYQL
ncbi:peptidase M50 [Verrucomicrobiaceae bacterium N1E253]|uniref:Peptidase M50 n=1 Tax=Oceaniferula marina TaxID=2748318 RepID=A0A851GFA3_9BACT|nr:peptidase M50 [Oceaniferula marina]NWK55879.1 peptidase M50 [Oceaniferula marina]